MQNTFCICHILKLLCTKVILYDLLTKSQHTPYRELSVILFRSFGPWHNSNATVSMSMGLSGYVIYIENRN